MVLITSLPIIEAGIEAISLQLVLCIWYLVQFRKDEKEVKALIDSRSEINVMTLVHAAKLGFVIRKTNISAQKIDSSILAIYRMIIADFLL